MANAKPFTSLNLGQPGRVTYVPQADGSLERSLRTTRYVTRPPHFQSVAATREILPPASSTANSETLTATLPSETHRMQRKWLCNNHMTATAGLDSVDGLLREELRTQSSEPLSRRPRLFDIGTISVDAELASTGHQCQLALAIATGDSGETLRILPAEEQQWAWNDEETIFKDAFVKLTSVDTGNDWNEYLWRADAMPISQIRFIASLAADPPTRWLVVQKTTSTTILAPKYHETPTHERRAEEGVSQNWSRFTANPLLTVTSAQTGGRAHVDFAYNPPQYGQPAQLAVIDEGGSWTVWHLTGSARQDERSQLRLIECRRGIVHGLDDAQPSLHGILFAGMLDVEMMMDESVPDETKLLTRAPFLIAWSSSHVDIVDLQSGATLPALSETKDRDRSAIMDVARSHINSRHIFILTSSALFCVRAPAACSFARPDLLMECPHLAPRGNQMVMSVEDTSEKAVEDLVCIHEFDKDRVVLNWYQFPDEARPPLWHRQVVTASDMVSTDEGRPFNFQFFRLRQAALSLTGESGRSGPGSSLHKRGVSFHECFFLDEHLSLRYRLYRTSPERALAISVPTTRLVFNNDRRRWESLTPNHAEARMRKLKHELKLRKAFAVHDGSGLTDLGRHLSQSNMATDGRFRARRKALQLNDMLSALATRIRVTSVPEDAILPSSLTDAMTALAEDAIAHIHLPLTVCQDLVNNAAETSWKTSADIEAKIEQLRVQFANDVLLPQLQGQGSSNPTAEDLYRKLTTLRADPTSESSGPRLSIQELNSRAFLSTRGMLIEDTPLFSARASEPLEPEAPWTPSQRPVAGIYSSPAPSGVPEPQNRCFDRLRLLSPGIKPGPLAERKKATILSSWPEERGSDLSDYVSSVAAASERMFDEARQRSQRSRSARSRTKSPGHRAPFMRQGFPEREPRSAATGPSSSQLYPEPPTPVSTSQGGLDRQQTTPRISTPRVNTPRIGTSRMQSQSQSQGSLGNIAMSQPAFGVFGDRKKTNKKTKRKSGFR